MTTEEKLKKIKTLADKMYSRMQYLTTDTKPIREAMEEYHQFVVHEYHDEESEECNITGIKSKHATGKLKECIEQVKKEPSISDIVDEHFWEMLGEEPVSDGLDEEICMYINQGISDKEHLKDLNDVARHFTQWQKNQIKKEAVEATCLVLSYPATYKVLSCYDITKNMKHNDKIKLITIKED